jgi:hypothetical protein
VVETGFPSADDLFIGPAQSDLGIEPHQHIQVVVHDREPADGD